MQKYCFFLFLKIITIVPLPGWKPRWAQGYRWWWGTWSLEVRSNSKVPGTGQGRVRQGQTTAIQARGWGHAFPPYILPPPKLLVPITQPLPSCNQEWGPAFPPPVLIPVQNSSLICNHLPPSPAKLLSVGLSDSPSIRGFNRSNSLKKCTRLVFGIAKLVCHWNFQTE